MAGKFGRLEYPGGMMNNPPQKPDSYPLKLKKVIIAGHYGFCMGVKRAIAIVEETMSSHEKVSILNEIVHNDAVVRKFSDAGVGQLHSIDEIDHGTIIISAHGASPEIIKKAQQRGLNIVDATCPLVIRIHKIIKKLAEDGYEIIHFGDVRHDETKGIVGHAPDKVLVVSSLKDFRQLKITGGRLALTSQTTAHMADFLKVEKAARRRFPQVKVFNTICNSTHQRQQAILELAPQVDVMLVVGSRTSANSTRLAQISKKICKRSYLINGGEDIKRSWLVSKNHAAETVGLSAGASTPDFLISGAIKRLRSLAGRPIEVIYPGRKKDRTELTLDRRCSEVDG